MAKKKEEVTEEVTPTEVVGNSVETVDKTADVEVKLVESTGKSFVILNPDGSTLRIYSPEDHGAEAEKLAHQFIEGHPGHSIQPNE